MKTPACPSRLPRALGLALVLSLFLSACATAEIDSNRRVGTFTHDQVGAELGPPDKSAQVSDGSAVVERMTHRGSPGGSGNVYGSGVDGGFAPYRPHAYCGGPAYYVQSSTPDHLLRHHVRTGWTAGGVEEGHSLTIEAQISRSMGFELQSQRLQLTGHWAELKRQEQSRLSGEEKQSWLRRARVRQRLLPQPPPGARRRHR